MPVRSAARSGRWPGSTPNSPATLGAVTSVTWSRSATPVGVTISRRIVSVATSILSGGLLGGARLHLVDAADHVEVLLRDVIELALDDLLEAGDGVLEAHQLAGEAGELGGHEERLREEL